MRFFLITAIMCGFLAAAHAQGLKLDVGLKNSRPRATDRTRTMYLHINVENLGQQKHKDLTLRWAVVLDTTRPPSPLARNEGYKTISLLPGDVTDVNTNAISISNRGGKPSFKGYIITILAGDKVLLHRIEPSGLKSEMERRHKQATEAAAAAAKKKKK